MCKTGWFIFCFNFTVEKSLAIMVGWALVLIHFDSTS